MRPYRKMRQFLVLLCPKKPPKTVMKGFNALSSVFLWICGPTNTPSVILSSKIFGNFCHRYHTFTKSGLLGLVVNSFVKSKIFLRRSSLLTCCSILAKILERSVFETIFQFFLIFFWEKFISLKIALLSYFQRNAFGQALQGGWVNVHLPPHPYGNVW